MKAIFKFTKVGNDINKRGFYINDNKITDNCMEFQRKNPQLWNEVVKTLDVKGRMFWTLFYMNINEFKKQLAKITDGSVVLVNDNTFTIEVEVKGVQKKGNDGIVLYVTDGQYMFPVVR